jgi:hypothetical protein
MRKIWLTAHGNLLGGAVVSNGELVLNEQARILITQQLFTNITSLLLRLG